MSKRREFTAGDRFGRLTLMSVQEAKCAGDRILTFRCDCGEERVDRAIDFMRSRPKSCGCLHREILARSHRSRGATIEGRETSEHISWRAMLDRVKNPNHQNRSDYQDRGIGVCDHWLSYGNFLADMGKKPDPSYTIERIDNEKGYEPANCRWATRADQMRNTRKNVMLTWNNMVLTLAEWARKVGIDQRVISRRLRRGWTVKEALTIRPEYGIRWRDANNKIGHHLYTINGETLTLTEWCSRFGMCANTVRYRMRRGFGIEVALTMPSQRGRELCRR